MFTLKLKSESNRLAEIMQQVQTKYAFCTKEDNILTQTCDFILCRDFLGDVLVSRFNKNNITIYGFTWDNNWPFDEEKTRLLVKFAKDSEKENFVKNIDILNQICYNNHFLPTEWFETDQQNIYFVEGDPWWQQTTWGLSFYTFMLRVLAYPIKDPNNWVKEIMSLNTNEGTYLTATYKRLIPFLESLHLIKLDVNPIGDTRASCNDPYGYHSDSGFVAMFRQYNDLWKVDNVYFNQITELLKEKKPL